LRRVMTAITVATVGLATTAATASAASINLSPLQSCYLATKSATLNGAGFTPGGFVNVTVDGQSGGGTQADTAGNFAGQFNFGPMKAVKTHTITATDATNPAITATTTFVGTTHQVVFPKRSGKPGKKVKLRGYGFIFGPKAFMHVRGHGIKSNKFLARPKAPCGTFTVRKAIVPSDAPVGKYRLQFDHVKRYSKRTPEKFLLQLTVFRTFNSTAFGGAGWALAPVSG
jgi:hypothetical protein